MKRKNKLSLTGEKTYHAKMYNQAQDAIQQIQRDFQTAPPSAHPQLNRQLEIQQGVLNAHQTWLEQYDASSTAQAPRHAPRTGTTNNK